MHESGSFENSKPIEVIFSGFDQSSFSRLEKNFCNSQILWERRDITNQSNIAGTRVLNQRITSEQFDISLKALNFIHGHFPSVAIVVVESDLKNHQIATLINEVKVFSIVGFEENLLEVNKKALHDSTLKQDYYLNLEKIKDQNLKLESLNKNLESLVYERTKREFEASKQTEVSLKGMQSILSFVKSVSRSETIEDLMNEVRNEFKKFHGLMPPVLVLLTGDMELRIFYFQGKQFTEKRSFRDGQSSLFSPGGGGDMRSELSNLFGRPYGSISVYEMPLNSVELSHINAKIVVEHSLEQKNIESFSKENQERWSLVNMALENILLKESLQSIAKQWSKTFNEMTDPIVIVDQNFNVTLSNSYFHEQIEENFYKTFSEGEATGRGASIQNVFLTGEPQTIDLNLEGKVFRVHSYPIRLIGSEIVTHVINQYVDITQFIDLQSKVIQGEKMAAVGLLAGNIAHELNNPLTGIYSLSQLLLEDFDEKSNTYKDLTEVKDAAGRCQRIIKDLLDFSNIGSESKVQVIDLNEAVQKTLPLLKMAMRSLNSNIQVTQSPIYVECNPQLFQQVIFNLVNNACQAMGDGGELTVITQKEGRFAKVIIRDTGPGIPQEIQEIIFDPFFTTKDEGQGTGLGLSMSKTVVERQGGQLHLNNSYKEGTEFWITLPMVEK